MAVEKKICWRLTRRCNLDCIHCLAGYKNREHAELGHPAMIEIFGKVARADVKRITWSGGEPTLNPLLPTLLQLCVKHEIRSILTTHGLNLRRQHLEALNKTTDAIRFSFDGLAQTHNAIRGGSFFHRTLETLKRTTSAGFRCEANITLLPRNVDEVPVLIDLLQESGVARIVLMTLMHRESAIDNDLAAISADQETALVSALRGKQWPGSFVTMNNYDAADDAYVVMESDGGVWLCSEHGRDQDFGSVLSSDGFERLISALGQQTYAHRVSV